MIKRCKKCNREFNASSEDQELCARCLGDEFASADVIAEEDLEEFSHEVRNNTRRQMARVERMNVGYASNSVFSSSGKLHFAFGMLLFLFCVVIYLIGDNPLTHMSKDWQIGICMSICVVAAGLVLYSSKRHRLLVAIIAVLMLGAGYLMPTLMGDPPPALGENANANAGDKKTGDGSGDKTDAEGGQEQDKVTLPPLTDEEESHVAAFAKKTGSVNTYAIYIDNSGAQVQSVLLESFKRIFNAGSVSVEPFREGLMFYVLNVQVKGPKPVARMEEYLGNISSTREIALNQRRLTVFLVHCSKDNLSNLRRENLNPHMLDPNFGDFVDLNLAELKQLDASRVKQAAKRFEDYFEKDGNGGFFRHNICKGLLDACSEPWNSNMETYTQMVRTLVVIVSKMEAFVDPAKAESDDDLRLIKRVEQTALTYVINYCAYKRRGGNINVHIPQNVYRFLVSRNPNALVNPVIECWKDDPNSWDSELSQLGSHAESALLELLHNTQEEQISADKKRERVKKILGFLNMCATAKSVPELKNWVDNEDVNIQTTAKNIISRFERN